METTCLIKTLNKINERQKDYTKEIKELEKQELLTPSKEIKYRINELKIKRDALEKLKDYLFEVD